MMDVATVSILIAIAGCFVGLAGWLSGRDKKISNDAEWRGGVNAKLDMIVGIKTDVNDLSDEVRQQGNRITAVEESAKQAHKRIDRHESREKGSYNND